MYVTEATGQQFKLLLLSVKVDPKGCILEKKIEADIFAKLVLVKKKTDQKEVPKH